MDGLNLNSCRRQKSKLKLKQQFPSRLQNPDEEYGEEKLPGRLGQARGDPGAKLWRMERGQYSRQELSLSKGTEVDVRRAC